MSNENIQVVVFKVNTEYCILSPNLDLLNIITIHDIAKKDVPHNCPYWVVTLNNTNDPIDFSQFDSIEPNGFGEETFDFSEEIKTKILEFYNTK